MLAPMYVQNANGRHVYLPEPMKLFRLRSVEDYDTEMLPAGHHYLRCGLDEVLFFLRPGHAPGRPGRRGSRSRADGSS